MARPLRITLPGAFYHITSRSNEKRPHDSLNDLTPVEYMEKNAENSTYKLSA